ncbi:MAG: hypothetical protein ACLPN1_18790 [Dissulfurispiraceae bacterium]|jgi:hypothetical protein
MTVQFLIGILVAVITVVTIGLVAVLWMLRDYARKYKMAVEGRYKPDAKHPVHTVIAPVLGSVVIYHDPSGTAHDALVTTVHNARMVNLVIVSKDDSKTDGYGRELERATSVPHRSMTQDYSYCFRFTDEETNPYESST